MIYKTEKDIFYLLTIWIVILLLIFNLFSRIYNKSDNILVIMITIISIVLLIWIIFGTYYKITKTNLKIRYGPFYKIIPINNITKIVKTKDIFISPSLSIKKLEIYHNNYETIKISPQNEINFIDELKNINPNIAVF